MNLKDKIKELCKKQNISLNQLEHELGFGKGYISKLGKSMPNSAKIQQIATRLNVSVDYLISGKENFEKELTERDENDISKDLSRVMEAIKRGDNGPIYFNGEEMSESSRNLLENAIEYALRETKKENKVKYNPHKNKK